MCFSGIKTGITEQEEEEEQQQEQEASDVGGVRMQTVRRTVSVEVEDHLKQIEDAEQVSFAGILGLF
jgi:hypothetical protein